MAVRELTFTSVAFRIIAACILGGGLGMEREMKNRPAGLRTYMLVCLGSCLLMMTNAYLCQFYQTGDPGRMGSQVVSGIGFLGAGTIVVTRHNQIRGLTTAAGLWTAAAVGLAIGVGFYEAAFLGACAVYLALTAMHRWDDRMHRCARIMEIYVELSRSEPLGSFLRGIRELELESYGMQPEQADTNEDDIHAFVITLKSKTMRSHDTLLESIRKIPGVVYLEEL